MAILVLVATEVDLVVGIANAPWWHEVVTAVAMTPAAAVGGGARRPRRHRLVRAQSNAS